MSTSSGARRSYRRRAFPRRAPIRTSTIARGTFTPRRIAAMNGADFAMSKRFIQCPSVMPDRYRCKLSFATSGSHAITAVTSPTVILATQTSPFGTAVQPQGWDQLANMYLKWRPIGMSLKITFGIPTTNVNSASCMLRGYWSQYATAAGSDLAIIQNRFTSSKYITIQDGFVTMKTYSPLHNVWGLTKQQWMNDEDTIADITTNPAKVTRYYYHFNCPDWVTGNNFVVRYEIIGDMYIEFSSPRILLDA